MLVNFLANISGVTLSIMFLVSGVSKLRDLDGFVLGVLEYQVLPARLAAIYGRILPLIEISTGSMLLLGLWPKLNGLLSIALLMSFLIAVSINILRRRKIDCHCFGSQHKEALGAVTVIRLCALLAGALVVTEWQSQTILQLRMIDLLPTLLIAMGFNMVLYMLSALPALWNIWRMKRVLGVTSSGGRVSLRMQPVGKSILDLSANASASTKEGGEP